MTIEGIIGKINPCGDGFPDGVLLKKVLKGNIMTMKHRIPIPGKGGGVDHFTIVQGFDNYLGDIKVLRVRLAIDCNRKKEIV